MEQIFRSDNFLSGPQNFDFWHDITEDQLLAMTKKYFKEIIFAKTCMRGSYLHSFNAMLLQ